MRENSILSSLCKEPFFQTYQTLVSFLNIFIKSTYIHIFILYVHLLFYRMISKFTFSLLIDFKVFIIFSTNFLLKKCDKIIKIIYKLLNITYMYVFLKFILCVILLILNKIGDGRHNLTSDC